ncbi:hypothetical protein [Roseobacter fucihabitans]|uniref:hypothetical protein n=1 Tax=Roseobacter fucihabitans TaxID=1537242 RepID=UPI0016532556|nr:hypothetical protein [Roseobacter litoralis]
MRNKTTDAQTVPRWISFVLRTAAGTQTLPLFTCLNSPQITQRPQIPSLISRQTGFIGTGGGEGKPKARIQNPRHSGYLDHLHPSCCPGRADATTQNHHSALRSPYENTMSNGDAGVAQW